MYVFFVYLFANLYFKLSFIAILTILIIPHSSKFPQFQSFTYDYNGL